MTFAITAALAVSSLAGQYLRPDDITNVFSDSARRNGVPDSSRVLCETAINDALVPAIDAGHDRFNRDTLAASFNAMLQVYAPYLRDARGHDKEGIARWIAFCAVEAYASPRGVDDAEPVLRDYALLHRELAKSAESLILQRLPARAPEKDRQLIRDGIEAMRHELDVAVDAYAHDPLYPGFHRLLTPSEKIWLRGEMASLAKRAPVATPSSLMQTTEEAIKLQMPLFRRLYVAQYAFIATMRMNEKRISDHPVLGRSTWLGRVLPGEYWPMVTLHGVADTASATTAPGRAR